MKQKVIRLVRHSGRILILAGLVLSLGHSLHAASEKMPEMFANFKPIHVLTIGSIFEAFYEVFKDVLEMLSNE